MSRTQETVERARTAALIAAVFVAVGLIVNLLLAWSVITDEQAWDPLGPYPTQRFEGFEQDGAVAVVSGELCSTETVEVLTILRWQAFTVVGQPIEGAFYPFAINAQQERQAGCETFCDDPGCDHPAFRNPITPELRALDDSLDQPHIWRITGQEIPLRNDGTEGVRERITSDDITLGTSDG